MNQLTKIIQKCFKRTNVDILRDNLISLDYKSARFSSVMKKEKKNKKGARPELLVKPYQQPLLKRLCDHNVTLTLESVST